MNIFLVALIISMALYLGIGWYAGRKVKSLDDYYVAGRNASTLLIVGTLVASFMSTNAFLGEMGFSYQGHGPLIVIMTGVNCMGYIFGALFFGRYLRRSRALTVPEFFGQRFQSRRLQALAGLTIVVGLTCYLMAVTWGVSLIVTKVTNMPAWASILLVWVSYTGFTLYSGSRGVILTDTVMFLLFSSVAVIALYYIIQAGGGWYTSLEKLAVFTDKQGIISWHGVIGVDSNWTTSTDALIWALILGVAWGIVVAVSPWQTSRYLMAKNEHVVIRSACGASIAMFLLYLINSYAASAVNLSNPSIDPPESVMIWVAMNLMPTILGALLVCGILAAGLSSASTFLSLIGFSASNDILIGTKDTEHQLKLTRYTIVAIGLIVVTLCLILPSNIFWITYFAGPVFASSWGVVAFMSIWSKRITEGGAFWGMLTGFVGNITANLLEVFSGIKLAVYLDPILLGCAISLVTVLVVSSAGTVSQDSKNFRERLHQIPQQDIDQAEIARTLIWPKAMILIGILIMTLMVNFYAKPYEMAIQNNNGPATELKP
jgi:sodium/pantothenate symporter